ncbi:hypothetical protein [Streptomyces sp. I6]|uniref:hypothetical protein n=1 Tax=Streptomyces sp. I6 TaxID=2483113 RepID=UPI000F44BCD5|nr:hypothetical protein [Streptomyces sp. I6]RNL73890.1 hypothetical protein EBF04_29560 [Streptomyces sp. I6]
MTTTLNRALARVDADALDAAVGVFVQAHTADPLAGAAGDPPVLQPAADGKTVRGARDSEGLQLHLLGVYQVAPGVMLAQREMRHKPHETVHLSTVLSAQLDALDWDETSNTHITVHRTEETNAGRHEIRIVRVQPLTPGQVNFPHATRALLVERYTPGRGDGKIHADAELGITPPRPPSPTPPSSPAACAASGPSRPSTSSEA